MVKYTKRRKIGGNKKSFSGIVCGKNQNDEQVIAEYEDRVSCPEPDYPFFKRNTNEQVTCDGNKIVTQKCKNIYNDSTRDSIDCIDGEYLANVCDFPKDSKCSEPSQRLVKKCQNIYTGIIKDTNICEDNEIIIKTCEKPGYLRQTESMSSRGGKRRRTRKNKRRGRKSRKHYRRK
jgi:hypothetical protein